MARTSGRSSTDSLLSLGLRWEYFGLQHNKHANLDSNFYYGAGSSIFPRDSATVGFPLFRTAPLGGLVKKDWNNFGPKLGFAYDIFGQWQDRPPGRLQHCLRTQLWQRNLQTLFRNPTELFGDFTHRRGLTLLRSISPRILRGPLPVLAR